MTPAKVAIVGAGVIGLSTAVLALETLQGVDITIIADEFSPNTTGDWSSGSISPYLPGEDLPYETLVKWFKASWDFYTQLCLSKEGGQCGIGYLPIFVLYNSPEKKPNHLKELAGFRDLTDDEIKLLNPSGYYRYGSYATTVFVECQKFLPYMLKRFENTGGKVQKRRINKFTELSEDFDIVVNCTGLGAYDVVPDARVIPVRGHLIRVRAPWIKISVQAEDFYVIPNSECVILGGTRQEGDRDTTPRPEDSSRIWNGCCRLVPSLENAEIINEWVGLRPSRYRPRIESEKLNFGGNKVFEIIHNYGHGGSGVTLAWGCAIDAVSLLKHAVKNFEK